MTKRSIARAVEFDGLLCSQKCPQLEYVDCERMPDEYYSCKLYSSYCGDARGDREPKRCTECIKENGK